MNKQYRKMIDEPNMSDKTLLISVEDLIWRAFGTHSKNTVNFKLLQTILHILARQLRLLEQDVEIKFDDIGIDFETGRHYYDSDNYSSDYDYYSDNESYSSGSLVGSRGARKGRSKKRGRKERGEKEEEKGRGEKWEKERGEKWEKGPGEKPEKGPGEKPEKGEKKERGEKVTKQDRREKGEREDKGETGEKKEKRSKDKRRGSKDSRVDEDDDGKGRDGRGKRQGGGRKRGEDDEDEGGERDGRGKRLGEGKRRAEDDEDVGGERDGRGRRQGERKKRAEDDEDEGGERDGRGRQQGERKRRAEDDENEGGERDDRGGRHGSRRRRGEDDKDESGERDGYGRRDGGRRRRGEKDEDEGGERDGYGRRHGGRSRRGDYDGDEGDERDGRRRGRRDGDRDERGRRHRVDREGSGTSITVTEGQRRDGGGGTVLIAERGPMTHGRVARVGSIEVVTASQFALLARAVRQLEQVTGPLPVPELPANKQLREDVLKGRASLSDTMEAVQLNARVQAAEEGLSRMAGLLTQLTAAGALPMDFASRIGSLQAELRKSTMTTGRGGFPSGPRAEGDPSLAEEEEHEAELQKEGDPDSKPAGPMPVTPFSGGPTAPSGVSGSERAGSPSAYDDMPVTRSEMQDILEQMKEALNKEMQAMTARANHSADIASNTSRNVSEKLGIALAIDERISTLYSQTADYAEQLNGFDTGLTTQMASFQEQMTLMRNDLKGGLEMLESANNNAETAAVLDLTERYETLVLELDGTVHLHNNLSIAQQQLSAELKTLVECVEMLREQKADRDEVLDGLRDKADITRLSGLLYEKDFAKARFEIEKRIEKSYDKFYKQDELWQIAMNDLTRITEHKAELIALLAFKERATNELNKIKKKQYQLEVLLGEPEAALLTRQLAAGAACGSCMTPAMMPLSDATHGKPALLPALRPAPLGAEEPCLAELPLRPLDTRRHICHRWVGGSHTLMAGNVTHEMAAQSHLETIPTKKYEGYGTDGKLYMMEEELLPCGECNKLNADDASDLPPRSPTPTGGGDRPHGPVGFKR